jgi:hypothetical protein
MSMQWTISFAADEHELQFEYAESRRTHWNMVVRRTYEVRVSTLALFMFNFVSGLSLDGQNLLICRRNQTVTEAILETKHTHLIMYSDGAGWLQWIECVFWYS